ncbi:MAG: hypothetical protein V3R73_04720, partial [Sphingomonadales bacterium]
MKWRGGAAPAASAAPSQDEVESLSFEQVMFGNMLEEVPINVMVADIKDFKITYANKGTFETLRGIEHLIPIKADQLIGTCIDVFHKDPQHQRRMLADDRSLPHETDIKVADEILALRVAALYNDQGEYTAAMVTWSVVTEIRRKEKETEQFMEILDQLPTNVLTLDPKTFDITYANKTSIDTLRGVQSLLPCPADQVVGSSVDIFHKNPAHQRALLADPSNLPYKANIKLGEHTLSLEVSAIRDSQGEYILALLCWSVITEQVSIAESVSGVSGKVAAAATELDATAETLSAITEDTRKRSEAVAAASAQASSNVSAVAAAAEELAATTTEISRQASEASRVSAEAKAEVIHSAELVNSLDEAGQKIGDVVNLINDIASQTN